MKIPAVIISVLALVSALTAWDSRAGAGIFSLASRDGAGFPGALFSLRAVSPTGRTVEDSETAEEATSGSSGLMENRIDPAPLIAAGQFRPQPLGPQMTTKSKAYTLLAIGAGLVVGGFVLLELAKISEGSDSQWILGLSGYCCIGLGALAIVKGLQVLILGTPGRYGVRDGAGVRSPGGIALALRFSCH